MKTKILIYNTLLVSVALLMSNFEKAAEFNYLVVFTSIFIYLFYVAHIQFYHAKDVSYKTSMLNFICIPFLFLASFQLNGFLFLIILYTITFFVSIFLIISYSLYLRKRGRVFIFLITSLIGITIFHANCMFLSYNRMLFPF